MQKYEIDKTLKELKYRDDYNDIQCYNVDGNNTKKIRS